MLASPKILVLDSGTLGKLANDFFSGPSAQHEKAQSFVRTLTNKGVYVAFPFTTLRETFRHADEKVFRSRFRFFRSLPLVAWIRHFDGRRGPGSFVEVLKRELFTFVTYPGIKGHELVESVRETLWETGTGDELFNDPDHEFWRFFRRNALDSLTDEKTIASVAQTNPGEVSNVTLRDFRAGRERTPEERRKYKSEFIQNLTTQLDEVGDKKLPSARALADEFGNNLFKRIEAVADRGENLSEWLSTAHGVPQSMVREDMTVEELGRLAVFAKKLRIVADSLGLKVTLEQVPPDSLPSLHLQESLWLVQRASRKRAESSNIGDNNLATFAIYADFLEVDSRTMEYLNQVANREIKLRALLGSYFKSSTYSSIAEYLVATSDRS